MAKTSIQLIERRGSKTKNTLLTLLAALSQKPIQAENSTDFLTRFNLVIENINASLSTAGSKQEVTPLKSYLYTNVSKKIDEICGLRYKKKVKSKEDKRTSSLAVDLLGEYFLQGAKPKTYTKDDEIVQVAKFDVATGDIVDVKLLVKKAAEAQNEDIRKMYLEQAFEVDQSKKPLVSIYTAINEANVDVNAMATLAKTIHQERIAAKATTYKNLDSIIDRANNATNKIAQKTFIELALKENSLDQVITSIEENKDITRKDKNTLITIANKMAPKNIDGHQQMN
ncbi:MAG: hypothetical protein IPP74_00030 [Alphaproteobacteria bacterium]|nr:hypothetical protein [Alphaproteobacteria bacterium]